MLRNQNALQNNSIVEWTRVGTPASVPINQTKHIWTSVNMWDRLGPFWIAIISILSGFEVTCLLF